MEVRFVNKILLVNDTGGGGFIKVMNSKSRISNFSISVCYVPA